MKMVKDVLCRSLLVMATVLFAGSTATAAVTLTDLGAEVKLDNGIVSATIGKLDAEILSLKYKGEELMGNGGIGYVQVVVDGKYSTPSRAAYAVRANEGSIADISHKWIVGGLEFDFHYVLRSGESGIYSYMTIEYDPGRAASVQIEQLNYCLRTDKNIFNRIYVDDGRIFDMPTPEEVAGGETLSPAEATLLANGAIDDKYHYSKYVKDTDVHGWTGKGKGHWMILASNEYMNGGPTSQELTVHQTHKTPVTLGMIHGAHYGSGVTNLDSSDGLWQKMCGPWLLYLNEGSDDDMWADAKKKAAREIAAWPYSWMNNPLYPLGAKRGKVTGRLNITDGSSPAGAMVLLGQPTDGSADTNWQRQGKYYIFWTEAGGDGSFTIDKVRAGTYTLYSNVSGVLGEYRLDGVNVKAGAKNDLGQLNWAPVKHGKLIWQIGIADRTAGEYRHGGGFRKWGLWLDYSKDFPDGITYTIGKSDPATDWNFNQWCVENSSGGYDISPWTINFDMDRIAGDQAVLTVAIAAARNARLNVFVNDVEVHKNESLLNDSAGPRAGVQGFYRERIIKFDSSILKANSTNRIVLKQTRAGLFPSIMYDCIRLETGFKADKRNN